MSIAVNIKTFLSSKFKELKIKRKDFIEGSGITRSGTSGLINGLHINPSLTTTVRIADYFNCPVDEVLGRKKYLLIKDANQPIFKTLSLEEMSNNVKLCIISELKIRNITAKQLASLCSIGNDIIMKLIKENSTKKSLSTRSVLAISDYFDVSIDEMIGRVDKYLKPNK